MSAVVNVFEKISVIGMVLRAVGLDSVWNTIIDAAYWIVDNIIEPILEFIFNLLGFDDEDVISGAASYTQLVDERGKSFLKELLKKNMEDYNNGCGSVEGPLDSLQVAGMQATKALNSPFYMMKASNTVQAPVTTIQTRDLNKVKLAAMVKSYKRLAGVVTINYGELETPSTNVYTRSVCNTLYGLIGDNMVVDGVVATFISSSYDVGTGYYTVVAEEPDTTPVVVPAIPSHLPTHYYSIVYNVDDGPDIYICESQNSAAGTSYFASCVTTTNDVEFMPILAIREQGVNVNKIADSQYLRYTHALANDGSDEDKVMPIRDTDKFNDDAEVYFQEHSNVAKAMGVSIDQLTAAVCSHDTKEDMDRISDAYVSFQLDVRSEKPAVKKAIFNMAKSLSNDLDEIDVNTLDGAYDSASVEEAKKTYVGKLTHNRFNQIFKYEPSSRVYINESPASSIGDCYILIDGGTLTARKQVDAYTMEEYTLNSFVGISALKREGEILMVTSNPGESETPLYMPLAHGVTVGMTFEEKADLYVESLHLIMYATEITHLEWYETPSFMSLVSFIITIIAILIAIFSWGSLTWLSVAMMAFAAGVQVAAKRKAEKDRQAMVDLQASIASKTEALKADIEGAKADESDITPAEMVQMLAETEVTMLLEPDEFFALAEPDFLYVADEVKYNLDYKVCKETKLP